MPNPEYENRIDDLVRRWKDDVYWGVLEDDVVHAVRIYAYTSLQGVTDGYDAAAIFPMFSEEMELPDHYGNGLFSRLSSACTSIRNALQAIHSHMDCHAAIAISRRAHESLWQLFWLSNPGVNADTRIKRLIAVTQLEIKEALRFWSSGINPNIESKLRGYLDNIQTITERPTYRPKCGWREYQSYFGALGNDPPQESVPSVTAVQDDGALVWSMMSNMAHPNVVFDWIIQIQDNSQDRMDRLQLSPTIDAIGMVVNLSTLIMQEAQMPQDRVARVNTTIKSCLATAESLLELKR